MRAFALLLSATVAIAPVEAATRRHIVGRHAPEAPYAVSITVTPQSDLNQIERALDLAAADGVRWVRMQFIWSVIQQSPGTADFRQISQLVFRATQDNLNVVGILGYATAWNTTAPPSETRAAQREHYPPADYDSWSRFVTLTVATFKDRVHYWEIWNQPDVGAPPDATHPCNGYWCGTPAQYAQLLAVSHTAIKAADPNAMVVLGGLSLGADANRDFLFQILTDPDDPAPNSFDVMNFRIDGSKNDVLNRVNFVKSQLFYGGAGIRRLWAEFGYGSDPAVQNVAPYFGGESGQAQYVTDMGPYIASLGIEKLFWLQFVDGDPYPSYGLLTSTLDKKQAYAAYGNIIQSFHP